MTTLDVVRRLQAFRAGRPLPHGETKRTFVADDSRILSLAFLRMGGESRPWAIAFGRPDRKPKILAVPEARNRDLVAAMVAEFAPVLLEHLQCPGQSSSNVTEWTDLQPLRQVWLPGDTHLDMLHQLAFAYTWTKHGGAQRQTLNAFGRACSWLFRESKRAGQQMVVLGTQVLREHYTFPCEGLRQNHLGYLLAWLENHGAYPKRLAAATEAEKLSTATSLDPQIERDTLAPLVASWGDAQKGGSSAQAKKAEKEIAAILRGEATRRWELVGRALDHLRSDKRRENAGLNRLVVETLKEQWYQYTRIEQNRDAPEDGPAYVPSVETDRHPAAAASRYLVHQSSAELVAGLLVHDDRELLADAIAAGNAFQGKIVRVDDEGEGRATRPIWRIKDTADRQLRLREGSTVEAIGFKQRTAEIRKIEDADGGGFEIEVELINCKTNRNPGPGIHAGPPMAKSLLGKVAAFVASSGEEISRSKSFRIWEKDGPGAWLTHGRPPTDPGNATDDDQDDTAAVVAGLERTGATGQ